jgi:Cu-processing system permease protein
VTQLLIIAGVTFREAARRKILWTALVAALAFLALFGTGMHFQVSSPQFAKLPQLVRSRILSEVLQIGFYAVDMLAVLMTVLTSVDSVSGEIASSTIQAVATKPIHRWQLLLGKWLGFAAMVGVYVLLVFGGVVGVGYFVAGILQRGAIPGAALVYLECLLVLTLTFLFGTIFSTLTNGVIVLGMHGLAFIGGWLEQIGTVTHSDRLINLGIFSSLLMPSEAVWRRASFVMQSSIARAMDISPFTTRSAPSPAMIGYAIVYLLIALACALYRFQQRDL